MTVTKEIKEAKSTELTISVKGEIVSSNFEEFKGHAIKKIDAINFDLVTDQHFGQAKDDIGLLKDFEKSLSDAEESMLKEMDDVYALITGSRELKEMSATKRKALNTKVTQRQKELRNDLIEAGVRAIEWQYPEFRAELEIEIKGKRSLAKMQEAIDRLVDEENIKFKANRKLIEASREANGEALVFGESDLMVMPTNLLTLELERRLERHRESIERQKLVHQAEELEKEKIASEAKIAEPVAIHAEPPTPTSPPLEVYKATPQQEGETEAQEMDRFRQTLIESFAPVKQSRQGLKHPGNIAKASAFADALKTAWGELNA